MSLESILSMLIQGAAAFSGAAWAAKRYVAPVKTQLDAHEKKDFEFHAKVEAVLWPAQR